jgi:hypothetical protein
MLCILLFLNNSIIRGKIAEATPQAYIGVGSATVLEF